MLAHLLTNSGILLETAFIDLSLAGDNAILLAMVVRHIPEKDRKSALIFGAGFGAFVRCVLSFLLVQLLRFPGISLIGAVLLLWVCYTLYKEIISDAETEDMTPATSKKDAIFKIIVADVSMSIDNVLGVAGATSNHPVIMILGLILSVILIILATEKITKLLNKYKWLSWMGLIVILFVSCQMFYHGTLQVLPYLHNYFSFS
ncbi:TerC family protein [Acetobacteraceae bacterium]|nr:TerC family protein [Acetobacteraceae bacterium]